MYNLHLLDSVRDYMVNDLPVAFTGSMEQCKTHALEQGYVWKSDNSLFGGYFAHPQTGQCLFINTGPVRQALTESPYEWEATYRCDQEEIFCTETHVYFLDTTVLSKAAKIIEEDIGDNTLISLKRTDV